MRAKPGCEAAGVLGGATGGLRHVRQQGRVAPERLAVAPPDGAERPAGERFARVPFALAVVNEAARAVVRPQALDQCLGERAFARPHRGGVPLGTVHVVDRNERRLATHGEPDVLRPELGVDRIAEGGDLRPLVIGVGKRDARRFVDARHGHREIERGLARVDRARDRSRARRFGGAGERQVALAREQARGRVETDPARARQVDFAPGVQVGEVRAGSGRTVERLLVRLQLNQIAGYKPGGEAAVTERLHHQPAGIAAGAGSLGQRFLGRLHPGLEPDDVADVFVDPAVEGDEEIDRALRPAVDARDKGREGGRGGQVVLAQVRREFDRQIGVVAPRKILGTGFEEEIERVVHRHLRHEVDLDRESARGLRKDEPAQVVALRVLLPVDEMTRRLDFERVTEHRGAAMRCGPEPHDLRPQADQAIVSVGGLVVKGDVDGHERWRQG